MAFNSNTQRSNNNQSQGQNDSWKAQGFLNLYLPTREGKKTKLGAIPLKESNGREKQLLAWLNEDPSRAAQILSKLEIEYRSAEAGEGSAFDL